MADERVRITPTFPRTRSPADDKPGQGGEARDQAAEARDQTADARDRASELRDDSADVRDVYAESRDRFDARLNAGAAADRIGARRDRQGGDSDRIQAADDRQASSTDRVLSARERVASSIDELTGAYRRDAGMAELEREMARANRTRESFVLAFVDVDGLKATNDSLGHAAGDQLLRRIVEAMRAQFRSYDLIIRFGGDEFLCALLALDVDKATERFVLINAGLASEAQASISFGLTEYQAHDSLDDLIARADAALLAERQHRPSARS